MNELCIIQAVLFQSERTLTNWVPGDATKETAPRAPLSDGNSGLSILRLEYNRSKPLI